MSESTALLKKKANVIHIYSERITGGLEKRGSDYWACCPFHGEKTPSFKIDHREGEWLWFCHGCKRGGDIISFLEAKGATFQEAIAVLERSAGPGSEWHRHSRQVTGSTKPLGITTDARPKKELPADYLLPLEEALQSNAAALRWLKNQRGIEAETAKRLRMGYVQTCDHVGDKDQDIGGNGWITFPRIEGDKLVALKYRSIARKAFAQMPGMNARALFNVETINPFDLVFVTDQIPRISLLDADGRLMGRCRGAINGAHGISGDADGNLYLAEVFGGRTQKYRPKPGADPSKLVWGRSLMPMAGTSSN